MNSTTNDLDMDVPANFCTWNLPADVTEIKVDCFSIAMYGDSAFCDENNEANEDHATCPKTNCHAPQPARP